MQLGMIAHARRSSSSTKHQRSEPWNRLSAYDVATVPSRTESLTRRWKCQRRRQSEAERRLDRDFNLLVSGHRSSH